MIYVRAEAGKNTNTVMAGNRVHIPGKALRGLRMIILPVVCCIAGSALHGQSVNEDPAITRMMESFVQSNKAQSKIRGWRIQITSTTDRRVMEDTQSRFRRIYPEYELLFVHQNPYYHLRTGAFVMQQDARPMLKKLQKDFPGAFIVSDEFEIIEVLNYLE
jgi:hypothetical protein